MNARPNPHSGRIAVLGTGKMGSTIADRLARAGFELTLWNRTRARAEALGIGHVATSPAEAAQDADIVISSLTGPDGVRAAYLGDNGALASASDQLFIDMSTAGAEIVAELAAAMGQTGARLVDAPIIGAPTLVRDGQAAILVGGAAADVDRARAVLGALGEVRHVGPLGSAARLKLVANSMLGDLIVAAAELQVAGEAAGLDPEEVFWVLQRLVPSLGMRRAGFLEDRRATPLRAARPGQGPRPGACSVPGVGQRDPAHRARRVLRERGREYNRGDGHHERDPRLSVQHAGVRDGWRRACGRADGDPSNVLMTVSQQAARGTRARARGNPSTGKRASAGPHREQHRGTNWLRDVILGGQDGLVNILGIILGVIAANGSTTVLLVTGLAAAITESISMGAVGYTSSVSQRDYYEAERRRELAEIEGAPEAEREEIRKIYAAKGFSGRLLERVVETITADRERWLQTMMDEELQLQPVRNADILRTSVVITVTTLIGHLIPLAPFVFLTRMPALITAFLLSGLVLFGVGSYSAVTLVGSWRKNGVQMVLIGLGAAAAGYLISKLIGAPG